MKNSIDLDYIIKEAIGKIYKDNNHVKDLINLNNTKTEHKKGNIAPQIHIENLYINTEPVESEKNCTK